MVKLVCKTCNKCYEFDQDAVPENAIGGWCNWCPECEDQAQDYYEEIWYRADGTIIE